MYSMDNNESSINENKSKVNQLVDNFRTMNSSRFAEHLNIAREKNIYSEQNLRDCFMRIKRFAFAGIEHKNELEKKWDSLIAEINFCKTREKVAENIGVHYRPVAKSRS